MGLCKCPKKKVTNQFCFEHRVNVCEHCMVSNHSKCVVQSYLQWLQDSDYDPNCHLCKTELAEGDCVRLPCYHVFHWDCLNNFASSLPSHTPPAGYTCPICNMCIFPQPNAVSPVADALKIVLRGVSWARNGLGITNVENNLNKDSSPTKNAHSSPMKATKSVPFENKTKPSGILNTTTTTNSASSNHSHINISSSTRPEPYGASYAVSYTSPRKLYDATEHGHFRPSMVDHDEDKYKRRSALEWFSRWFRSRTVFGNQKRDPSVVYKKWVVVLILCLLALCTLCILLLRFGRPNADSDPLLDPRLNPNIRVEEAVEEMNANVANAKSKIIERNSVKEHVKEILPA